MPARSASSESRHYSISVPRFGAGTSRWHGIVCGLAVRRHQNNRQNKVSLAKTYSPNDCFHKPSAGFHSKTIVFYIVWRTQIPHMIAFYTPFGNKTKTHCIRTENEMKIKSKRKQKLNRKHRRNEPFEFDSNCELPWDHAVRIEVKC